MFLKIYQQLGTIENALRRASMGRNCHTDWLKLDPTYRPRFLEARRALGQKMRDAAFKRATEGTRKMVMYKGKPVTHNGQILYETTFSDQLLIKLLEATEPESFRSKQENQAWDGDIHKLLDSLTPAQYEQVLINLERQAAAGDSTLLASYQAERLAITAPDAHTAQSQPQGAPDADGIITVDHDDDEDPPAPAVPAKP